MAGVKISALPAASSLLLADVFPIVQSGTTYKATLSQLFDLISNFGTVRLASTANLTAVYNNGTAGVGATLTNSGALAALSLDGTATVAGNLVLIKDQTNQFENGLYTVTTVGSGAVAWVLTRSTNYDAAAEITQGDFVTVGTGTTNGKTQWIQTQVVATVGTDNIVFESNVVAGTGITKSNNTIALTVPVAMANGGTNKVMVASNGAVAYSDVDSLELSAVGSAGQLFQSAGAAAPVWTTATFPATAGSAGTILRANGTNWVASTSTFADTYLINSILYNGSANTVTGLAPALSSVLLSSAASTGVPTWSGALTNGQLIIGSTGATPVVAALTPGTGISIANGAGSVTISATGGGFGVATIAGTSQAAAVNTMYIALNAGQTTLTLPAVYSVGDTVILVGSTANTGGWVVTASAGDTVIYNGSTTSAGGTITSSALAGQTIEMVCDVANTSWVVVDTVNTLLTTA
jgi:hypothetical protein